MVRHGTVSVIQRAGLPHSIPRVLLLAGQREWVAAARLPALLRQAGVAVDLYAHRGSVVGRSRFVDRRLHAPDGDLPYFDELRRLIETRGHEWCWVLPATGFDVRGLAIRARDRWAAAILPARPERDVTHALLSRASMDALLGKAGVRLPRSRVVPDPEALGVFAAEVPGALVLKPVDGVSGRHVSLLHQAGAREDAFLGAVAEHPVLLAQEYVPGRVGCCQAVVDTGRLLAWMTAWKGMGQPGVVGPASQLQFAPIAQAGDLAARIGEALGFHGLLSFDFVEDRDGAGLVVVEVNPWPASVAARCSHAGVNLAAAIRSLLFGVPLEGHVAGTQREATVPLFPQHLARSLAHGDVRALFRALSPSALADVPWGDPGLLGAQLGAVARGLLR